VTAFSVKTFTNDVAVLALAEVTTDQRRNRVRVPLPSLAIRRESR
jgi:hypothetical protein